MSIPLSDRARIALARLHRHIGWTGAAGSLMLALSAAVVANGQHQRSRDKQSAVTLSAGQATVRTASASTSRVAEDRPGQFVFSTLPRQGEVAALVGQIQQAAVENGLVWPKADYRIAPQTEKDFARLEVICAVKGPYPHVRRMVSTLLQVIPGLSVREFAVSRPNGDTADVDARLTLGIFLQDASPLAGPKDAESRQ